MKLRPTFDISGTGFFAALILIFLIVLLAPHMLINVPSGCVGVLWRRFQGTAHDFHFSEGLKIIPPWDKIFIYDARLQSFDYSATAPSSSGLSITVDTSISFAIFPAAVGHLHMKVGPNYVGNLILPLAGSTLREWIASGTDEEHYSYNHRAIETELKNRLQLRLDEILGRGDVSEPLIRVAYFGVRSISLPRTVTESIEAKMAAEQNVRRYKFVIEQSRLEADRRAAEAEGIRRFQEIVTPTISESFLRWRGIEATLALSQSPNTKIVVVGGGSSGLPLILDGRSDLASSSSPSSKATPPVEGIDASASQASGSRPPLLNLPSFPTLLLPPMPPFAPQPSPIFRPHVP